MVPAAAAAVTSTIYVYLFVLVVCVYQVRDIVFILLCYFYLSHNIVYDKCVARIRSSFIVGVGGGMGWARFVTPAE